MVELEKAVTLMLQVQMDYLEVQVEVHHLQTQDRLVVLDLLDQVILLLQTLLKEIMVAVVVEQEVQLLELVVVAVELLLLDETLLHQDREQMEVTVEQEHQMQLQEQQHFMLAVVAVWPQVVLELVELVVVELEAQVVVEVLVYHKELQTLVVVAVVVNQVDQES